MPFFGLAAPVPAGYSYSPMTWDRFKSLYYTHPKLGLSLDVSRMPFPDDFPSFMEPRLKQAFADMAALEGGAIANPDEKRMVGHYWLRAPELAPTEELRTAITSTLDAIKTFVAKVHKGGLTAPGGAKFKEVLVIGIGGSALGPQFVSHALGRIKGNRDKMGVSFFDNTDPDGMDRIAAQIGAELATTVTLVISKSGGTKETRNGMLEAAAAYKALGLNFAKHAVAVTGPGSDDYDDCEALVAAGMMTKRSAGPLSGGDPVYRVTDAGQDALVGRPKTPNVRAKAATTAAQEYEDGTK